MPCWAEALNKALSRLPERYLRVIELRHHDQLPFEDVARRMDLTAPAARQLWVRAITRLTKELLTLGIA